MSSEIVQLRDGVQLGKRFEDEEFHLPSVVYEFNSERSDVVDVRVEEQLPDGIGPEHIGFHNEFGRDNWTLIEDTIVCEATLEPAGECKAVYALRPEQEYDPDQLTTEPDRFTVSRSPSAVVPAGQSEALTRSAGPDDDGADGNGTNGDVTNEYATDGDGTDSDGTAETEPRADQPDSEPSLVDRLVAELRDGTASEESQTYLEQEFGGGLQPPGSVDARITQLQADVGDLQAYSNAMEEFLDEYGSPDQVAERVGCHAGVGCDRSCSSALLVGDDLGPGFGVVRARCRDVEHLFEGVVARFTGLQLKQV